MIFRSFHFFRKRSLSLLLLLISSLLFSILFIYGGSPSASPYPGEVSYLHLDTNSASTSSLSLPSINIPNPPPNVNPPTNLAGGGGNPNPIGAPNQNASTGVTIGGDLLLAFLPFLVVLVILRFSNLRSPSSSSADRKKAKLLYSSIQDLYSSSQALFDQRQYRKLIVDGYHHLEQLLDAYYQLTRGQSLTPLEFAEQSALPSLKSLVELFYQTHYGSPSPSHLQRYASLFLSSLHSLSRELHQHLSSSSSALLPSSSSSSPSSSNQDSMEDA